MTKKSQKIIISFRQYLENVCFLLMDNNEELKDINVHHCQKKMYTYVCIKKYLPDYFFIYLKPFFLLHSRAQEYKFPNPKAIASVFVIYFIDTSVCNVSYKAFIDGLIRFFPFIFLLQSLFLFCMRSFCQRFLKENKGNTLALNIISVMTRIHIIKIAFKDGIYKYVKIHMY